MNKKQSKRQRDIKTKLIAAICMLLVSSIMMVSTTYAWFTLSTAPEVTGINTAVGANGNLEMALLPLSGDVNEITSGTNQSMAVQTPKVSNVTWGNLVKLDGTGDQSYGLEKITLYPSALNATTTTTGEGENEKTVTTLLDNPLSTPEYGADGRIAELKANTITGTYRDGDYYEKEAFGTELRSGYGVRAIGTQSGMSPRNLAYRQALAAANTAASKAKSVASTSLNNNGSILADVAITHALNSGTAQDVYDETDLNAMKNVVNDLLGPGENVGALEYIESALKDYIVATTLATAPDDTYADLQKAIEEASLADLKDGNVAGAVVTADMKTWIGELQTAVDNVTVAHTKLGELTGGSYTWNQISPALTPLVSTSGLLINDTPVADVMADPGAVAGSIMANGLTLTMGSGSGVFSDIADFAGNYSAGIIIPKLAYGTIEVPNVQATMNTDGISPTYLALAAKAVPAFQDGTSNGGDKPLTDFYGYIIDLAFRTNAAESWLQIQPDAVDRIYADGTNVNTMGHGATMSFTSSDATFSTAAVTRLMGAIRIIFFDTASKEVITYARLDAANATTDEAGKVTMPLALCDHKGDAQADDATTTDRNEAIGIMPLTQNQVHQLSIMVYLDGELVGNDDVAAENAQSMSGTMNLQFSSSAHLVAMDYANLKSGEGGALNGGAGGDEEEEEDEPIILNAVTSSTYTIVGGAYDGTNVAIQLTGATAGDAVVVTIGGTAHETVVLEQDGKLVVVVAAADVEAGTAITVEPKA